MMLRGRNELEGMLRFAGEPVAGVPGASGPMDAAGDLSVASAHGTDLMFTVSSSRKLSMDI